MPRIRLAWGTGYGAETLQRQGKWIPDTERNRRILAASIEAFHRENKASMTFYWIECDPPRAKSASPIAENDNNHSPLPWWQDATLFSGRLAV